MGATGTFARFVTGHARAVALGVALATGLALAQIVDPATLEPRIRIDVSMESMLPKQDEELLFWERLERIFGGDETLLLVVHRPEGMIERQALAALGRLTSRLESQGGIARVVSLANTRNVRGADGDLVVEPLLAGVPESETDLARVRADALGNPLLVDNLIAPDARTTMLLLYLEPMPEAEFSRRGIDGQVLGAARDEFGDTAQVWLTGSAYVRAETTRYLLRDLLTLI